MSAEYTHLMALQESQGYKILQALWAKEHAEIVKAMRKAGKRGNETSWRYFAGQQEGFELAVTHLERALLEMQVKSAEEGHESDPSNQIEELFNQLRETKKNA